MDWELRCQQVAHSRGGRKNRSKQEKHYTDPMNVETRSPTYSEFATFRGAIGGFHGRSAIGLALGLHGGRGCLLESRRQAHHKPGQGTIERPIVEGQWVRADASVEAVATMLEWVSTRGCPMVASNAPRTSWISAGQGWRLGRSWCVNSEPRNAPGC